MDKYVEAEKRLAELLGWQVNEQVVWPKWARDNERAFELMVGQGISLSMWSRYCVADNDATDEVAYYADHPSKEAAVRYAIVQAVIAKLEGEKK